MIREYDGGFIDNPDGFRLLNSEIGNDLEDIINNFGIWLKMFSSP